MIRELKNALQASLLTIFIIIFFIAVGVKRGKVLMERKYQKELVNRGYAIHNPTNGVWQWK